MRIYANLCELTRSCARDANLCEAMRTYANWRKSPARESACAVARLGREGFQLQAVGGSEVLDVGGEERQVMHDGGGADQGIGQTHAVR